MKPMVLSEVKRQLWLAGPMIVGKLLQYAVQVISVMFVGHLGELSLAGASMATSFASVTGFSLLLGGASAMDTLCGQAYGAKEYHLVGIYKQRAMIILTLLIIPLSIILFYTGQILHFCHQTSEISLEAGVYAKWMIPSLLAFGLLQCHVRFLHTQNIVFPSMISNGFTVVIHVFVCWILVYKLGMGSKGAALATGISYWVNTGILAVYVRISKKCRKTWVGFSKEGCRDLIGFVKLATPSALMLCLSWWSFEIMVLLSGLLPNPQLESSALSIILNTSILLFMIPSGLGAAISTRVSNELGAGQPQAAKLAVFVVLFLAITQGLIMGLVLILIRNIFGYAYSNDEKVIKYVALLLPFVSISNILDGIQGVLLGVVRGCGLQKFGAWVNLGAFYIIGIPCAILFAFVAHLGGKGLWMGIICGLFVQVLALLIMSLFTNWEKEARKAKERVSSSSLPTM